jgi:hypothetical protein
LAFVSFVDFLAPVIQDIAMLTAFTKKGFCKWHKASECLTNNEKQLFIYKAFLHGTAMIKES